MMLHTKKFSTLYGQDNLAICDLPGFVEFAGKVTGYKRTSSNSSWYGGMLFDQSLECVRKGDLAGVPASDKFLAAFENLIPVSRAWRTYDSVVGGSVNVPAFLAGQPLSMRQRRRVLIETAPLCVMADLTSSAGISADNVRKRGCAILALVRLLSAIRPVELWAVIALGVRGQRDSVCVRLDTAPLDLARAAHVLTHPSVSRCLGYGSLHQAFNAGGQWGYGDIDKHRKCAADTYREHLCPGSDALFVPPVFLTDDSINAPEKWLRDMIARYGGMPAAA